MNSLKQVEQGLKRRLTHDEVEGQLIMTELCKLQDEITQEEYVHVRSELIPRLKKEE